MKQLLGPQAMLTPPSQPPSSLPARWPRSSASVPTCRPWRGARVCPPPLVPLETSGGPGPRPCLCREATRRPEGTWPSAPGSISHQRDRCARRGPGLCLKRMSGYTKQLVWEPLAPWLCPSRILGSLRLSRPRPQTGCGQRAGGPVPRVLGTWGCSGPWAWAHAFLSEGSVCWRH